MSDRLDGGYIGAQPQWGANASSGIWTLSQQSRRRLSNVWPTLGDTYYDNVTMLLHMEGVAGSRTFTDSSKYNVGMTSTAFTDQNATLSSTQKKFGNTSARFDGNYDWIHTAWNSRYTFGSGDFTVELWFYAVGTQYATLTGIWSSTSDAAQSWTLDVSPSTGYIAFIADFTTTNDTVIFQVANLYSMNTWVNVAVTRQGGTWRLFVDGALKATTTTTAGLTLDSGSQYFTVGGLYGNTSYSFNGYIDEVRITKGICRYTSDYTVSSAPFPDFM